MLHVESAYSLDVHSHVGISIEAGEPAEECSRSQDLERRAQRGARRGVSAGIAQASGCVYYAP